MVVRKGADRTGGGIEAVDLTSGDVTYTAPPPAAPGFWSALNFSARESISLLQARSVPTITTTGAGNSGLRPSPARPDTAGVCCARPAGPDEALTDGANR